MTSRGNGSPGGGGGAADDEPTPITPDSNNGFAGDRPSVAAGLRVNNNNNNGRLPPTPATASSSQEESQSEAEGSPPPPPPRPLFARCKSVRHQSSQDVSLLIEEEDERDGSNETPEVGDVNNTNGDDDATTSQQQQQRLRPPLSLVTGMSADSGAGDLGSDNPDTGQPPAAGNAAAAAAATAAAATRQQPLVSKGSVKNKQQTVKPFTKESLDRLESKSVQLVRDYGFQPRRKTSVEDGAVLPNKFEPFPNNLYGKPLEEIDHFIYDEVSFLFF